MLTFYPLSKLFLIIFALLTLIVMAIAIWRSFSDKPEPEQPRPVNYFRPASFVFLIIVASIASPITPGYKAAVLAGLILALLAEIFMMLPGMPRLVQRGHLLLRNLVYLLATLALWSLQIPSLWGLGLLLYAGLSYRYLVPRLSELKIPTLIYAAVLLLMSWLTLEVWMQTDQLWALVAFAGTALLVISDTLAAFEQFRGAFKGGQQMTTVSYYLALWLVALSVSSDLLTI